MGGRNIWEDREMPIHVDADQAAADGLSCPRTADSLHIAPRTLRHGRARGQRRRDRKARPTVAYLMRMPPDMEPNRSAASWSCTCR
jgi:hypothetical protein